MTNKHERDATKGARCKDMVNIKKINDIRHRALLVSERTKNTVFAFSNGTIFIVYNPLSAKHCTEEQNKAGAYLIGRYRNGYEV